MATSKEIEAAKKNTLAQIIKLIEKATGNISEKIENAYIFHFDDHGSYSGNTKIGAKHNKNTLSFLIIDDDVDSFKDIKDLIYPDLYQELKERKISSLDNEKLGGNKKLKIEEFYSLVNEIYSTNFNYDLVFLDLGFEKGFLKEKLISNSPESRKFREYLIENSYLPSSFTRENIQKKSFLDRPKEQWTKNFTYSAKITKISEDAVYCDLLMDEEKKTFSLRTFDPELFAHLEKPLDNKFVSITIRSKPGASRIDVVDGQGLVNEELFDLKSAWEGLRGQGLDDPLFT